MLETPSSDNSDLLIAPKLSVQPPAQPLVKHFRQVLLWPLRLMPVERPGGGGTAPATPWQILRDWNTREGGDGSGATSPWREVVKEYTGSADQFHERHYNEFVTFLPYVPRFLHGEGRTSRTAAPQERGHDGADGTERRNDSKRAQVKHSETDSPMRVFRRTDVAQVRVLAKPGEAPITLDIVHTDLYFFLDVDLVQFRHQHFLLFLIAHFQKASLLMFSDRLVEALKNLTIENPGSVRRFKRAIRASFEGFLRFTHRYWVHEVAEQAQARALFHMTATHLGLDPLYAEVKERIADMNSYLDADSLRRQANTVVRLTVVTIFGLIGTVTTGFLDMNLLAEADAPLSRRIAIFAVVFVTTASLTVYTMAKSNGCRIFWTRCRTSGCRCGRRPSRWRQFGAQKATDAGLRVL